MGNLFAQAGVDMTPADDMIGDDASLPASQETETTGPDEAAATVTPEPEDASFFDPAQLPEELQGHWKRMQAAFTRGRQKDRETARGASEKAMMVDRFYNDPAYALQVLQQVAPALGVRIETGQRTPAPTQETSGTASRSVAAMEGKLAERLGPDLAWLAPKLAEGVLASIEETTQQAIAPLREQLAAQQAREQQVTQQAFEAEQARVMAALDAQMPGWEEQYGGQMRELDAFLNSNALTHPTFGSKHELYLKLLNPAAFRVQAVRDIGRAAANRVASGRTGSTASPGMVAKIREKHTKEGWQAAWKFAIQNIDAVADEVNR